MNRIKLAVVGAIAVVFCGYTQPGWAQTQISLGRAKPLSETSAANDGYFFNAPSQYGDAANSNRDRFYSSKNAFESNAYQRVPNAVPAKRLPNAYHAQMCRFEEPAGAPAVPSDLSDAALQDVDDLVQATGDAAPEVILELDDQDVQPTVEAAPAAAAGAPAIAPLNEAAAPSNASVEASNGGPVVYQPVQNPADTSKKKLPYPTKPENRVEKTRPIDSPWTIPKDKANNNGGVLNSACMGGQCYGYAPQPSRAWNRPLYSAFTGAMTGDYATGYDPELAAQAAANAKQSAPQYFETAACVDLQGQTFEQNYAFCESGCYDEARIMSGIIGDVEYLGWQSELSEDSSVSPNGSGIRSRLGYRGVSGWDLVWNYTYFTADEAASAGTKAASSDVQLSVYSLELGKWNWYYQSGFRPFIGFQWTQLKEESLSYSTHNSYGLRFGSEWKHDLGWNFQAYARAAGVVGVGETGIAPDSDAQKIYGTDGAGAVEAALGLAWRKGNFQIQGGYEFNDWFNAAKVDGKNSDFFAYGWFAGISWNR
ncbi:MAG: hypothetical protein IKX88_11600 [Thermoguttaceae bacterium]|nr:hypothetical protein [Thermoguttaceae bacterium]